MIGVRYCSLRGAQSTVQGLFEKGHAVGSMVCKSHEKCKEGIRDKRHVILCGNVTCNKQLEYVNKSHFLMLCTKSVYSVWHVDVCMCMCMCMSDGSIQIGCNVSHKESEWAWWWYRVVIWNDVGEFRIVVSDLCQIAHMTLVSDPKVWYHELKSMYFYCDTYTSGRHVRICMGCASETHTQ